MATASPLLLEDVARLQGTGVAVLPRGRLRHAAQLSVEALNVLLHELLGSSGSVRSWGRPDSVQLGGAAPRTPVLADPGTTAAAPAAPATPSAVTVAAAATPASSSGFAPITTDLPDLLRRSLESLPGGMAAAVAAVADVSTPTPVARAASPSAAGDDAAATAGAAGMVEPSTQAPAAAVAAPEHAGMQRQWEEGAQLDAASDSLGIWLAPSETAPQDATAVLHPAADNSPKSVVGGDQVS